MHFEVIGHLNDPNFRLEDHMPRYASQLWYNALAKRLRADDTDVVRVDPGKRSPVAIRQAMRHRGLYVRIEAKAIDRPFVTITLTQKDQAVDAPEPAAAPPGAVVLTDAEAEEWFRQQGIDPTTR